MLFTNFVFLFYFFPVAIAVYYIFSFSKNLRNIWLILISLVFYGWAEPLYIFGLMALIVLNMGMGIIIEKNKDTKAFLIFAIGLNILVLFAMKYLDLTASVITEISGYRLLFNLGLHIPIGISFFVLRAISYLVDIYRGKTQATSNIIDLGLYFAFFPILIAGPIVSFQEMRPQIKDRKHNLNRVAVGFSRFVTGFAKKAILANAFALIATRIFDLSTIGKSIYDVPALLAWLGALTFVLQIYFDYSAYCDMAIGLGLIFGFKFPENFNYPLSAITVTQFWKRFNITLFGWFDEYLSKSLYREDKKNKDRAIRNTLILWVLIGLWHGPNLTFVAWGIFNFVLIIMEEFLDMDEWKVKPVFLRVYTILVITLGFVIFKAKDLYQAGIYIGNMFARNHNGFYSDIAMMYLREYGALYILGIIFATPLARKINSGLIKMKWGRKTVAYNAIYPLFMTILFVVSVAYIIVLGNTEFVFYR
ncbi:MBOAT family O-acyltransferase [Proteocatella sphenisci]|uniref:MBOAT family O-acyltransferase n=1 Tax=Proteocatella sphenisci TaxID=181070 RepID=UPI00048FC5AA|nr:MBOAT family O-acyltransferase [Proteocatella sphenisci]